MVVVIKKHCHLVGNIDIGLTIFISVVNCEKMFCLPIVRIALTCLRI